MNKLTIKSRPLKSSITKPDYAIKNKEIGKLWIKVRNGEFVALNDNRYKKG